MIHVYDTIRDAHEAEHAIFEFELKIWIEIEGRFMHKLC